MVLSNHPIREEETLVSELQGPRIPGEEGSRRRRPLGWIIGGLIALLLLALLIPFACQALRGGSDSQGGGSGGQERTSTQGADNAQGAAGAGDAAGAEEPTGAGETTRTESAQAGGSQGGEATTATDRAARSDGEGGEEASGDQAGAGNAERLPESGGMSPAILLAVGASLVAGAAGLCAWVRRCTANGG